MRPAAAAVRAVVDGEAHPLESIHPAGIFEGVVDGVELPLHYTLEVDYQDLGTVASSRIPTASCRRSATSTCT